MLQLQIRVHPQSSWRTRNMRLYLTRLLLPLNRRRRRCTLENHPPALFKTDSALAKLQSAHCVCQVFFGFFFDCGESAMRAQGSGEQGFVVGVGGGLVVSAGGGRLIGWVHVLCVVVGEVS